MPPQVREMLKTTPSLLGVEASDANDVANYLRTELGLRGKGQLASALAGCPPMLMYHAWDNLRKKVKYMGGKGGEGRGEEMRELSFSCMGLLPDRGKV